MDHRHPPSPLTVNLGRIIAWPLIVGGGVLAVAWAGWSIATGAGAAVAISVAISGLAAFSLAVVAMALTVDLLSRAVAAIGNKRPTFLSLDWMVPAAVVIGFLVGWAVWK